MEQIALISDIHGNIPALEATLKDIKRRGIQRIFCLGDLVGKGPDSAEAVDICRAECEATVLGNWDEFIVTQHDHPTAQWHRERLGVQRLDELARLPHTIDFWLSGQQVRLFHASQIGIYHRVYMTDSLETQSAMFENTPFTGDTLTPTMVGYGDIHWAYVHCFEHRILFNVGSVGNPLDLTQASYAILEGVYGGQSEDVFSIQLMRVPYDIELAIQQAQAADMPDLEAYASELRTSRYRGLPPVIT
ncbi:MAG: metallophosphoesterase [Herpetosiphonaceae bacterium]|nr:metallophosphoesterase [Herpetosiphonaceae bacterium]